MKVLITGSTGFIGSKLIEMISEAEEVFALTNKSMLEIRDKNVVSIECPMNDYKILDEILDEPVDLCIHLAWSGISTPEKNDYLTHVNNLSCTLDLVKSLHTLKCNKFIGVGSIAEKEVLAYNLSDCSTPNRSSLYGIFKLATHMSTKSECCALGMDHIWCTLGNAYGLGDQSNTFVNMAMKSLKGKDVSLFTKGEQLYDFVHIDDVIAALDIVIHKGCGGMDYYVGSGSPRPLKEYIMRMKEAVNPNKEVILGHYPFNGVSLRYDDYDISSLRALGYGPKHDFDEEIINLAATFDD